MKTPIQQLIDAAEIIVGTHSLDDYRTLHEAISAAKFLQAEIDKETK